jgi:hypothetical protein
MPQVLNSWIDNRGIFKKFLFDPIKQKMDSKVLEKNDS